MKKWFSIILVSIFSMVMGTSCSSLTDNLAELTLLETQGDFSPNTDPDSQTNPTSAHGYFGRIHGDADGIPPDGQIRTNWGVYPAGGLGDEEQNDSGEKNETGSGD